MSEILAIIPARGGSKGLPRKNIRPVAGQPLIAWTVRAAQRATSITRVVVSTDDEEIAKTARQFGAEVPFLRPAELARDETPQTPPLEHALQWLAEKENYHPEIVVMLQPTSPLRTAEDIDLTIETLVARTADAVVSVYPAKQHPFWTKLIDAEGRLRPFIPNTPATILRRQDLPAAYSLNGAVYAVKTEVLLRCHTLFPDNLFPYVMPAERSLDIDTLQDLHVADLLLAGVPFP